MKTKKISRTLVPILFTAIWAWTFPTTAANPKPPTGAAAKLVQETLQQEADEGVEDRAELLKPALEQKPPCEEAYWQSGMIYDAKRKKWFTVDDVQQQAAAEANLTEYQKIREKYLQTVDGQSTLARWCAKRKLDDQARAHWNEVLKLAPDHLEARRQLGFQAVNGKWLSQKEIADDKAQAKSTQAALKRWAPKLEDLLGRMAGSNRQAADRARQELAALNDPDVVPAIVAMLFGQDEERALYGVDLLHNLRSAASAEALAWHAVFSPWEPVGQAAARALGEQEKYDYVPLLLEAAETPPTPQNQLASGSGNPNNPGNAPQTEVKMLYRLERGSTTRRWRTVEQLNEHPLWQNVPKMRFDPRTPEPVAKRTNTTVQQGANSKNVKQKEFFTIKNDRVQQRITDNQVTTNWQRLRPVGPVVVPKNPQQMPFPQQPETSAGGNAAGQSSPLRALAEATGEHRPSTISDWWDWWYDYNEVYNPSGKPLNNLAQADNPADANKEAADPDLLKAQRGDCLAAGTLVATESGMVPIEKLSVGDRVFCCDPETGCVALKPVLRTTARPAGMTLKIRIEGEEFQSSGGHKFWVSGRGWVKARDLTEGMRLHTLRGTLPVEAVEPSTTQATHSLATADFATFFVGKAMILTHDNTIHPPTPRLVPGLATEKETQAERKTKNRAK